MLGDRVSCRSNNNALAEWLSLLAREPNVSVAADLGLQTQDSICVRVVLHTRNASHLARL
jgi:hypothetical protein